jgi:hypothetical protein
MDQTRTVVRRLGRREVLLQMTFIPLGCDVNDEKNLPLVGAEVNVFAAGILHKSSKQKAIVRLPAAKSEAAASTLLKIRQTQLAHG